MQSRKILLRKLSRWARSALIMVGIAALATGVSYAFQFAGFPETNTVIIYIFSVLLTARFTDGFAMGIIASVVATFTFNYFFTAPHYTFSVNDPTYIITFTMMTVTALVTSALTSKIKQSALDAQRKEAETQTLYRITTALTDTHRAADVASIVVECIGSLFSCSVGWLAFDEAGLPEPIYLMRNEGGQLHRPLKQDRETLRAKLAGAADGFADDGKFCDWPIKGQEAILGAIRIPTAQADHLTDSQRRFLRLMAENIALGMDRLMSAQQRTRANEDAIRERYRANLLRAISHDLRTPLTGMIGAAEMLMSMSHPGEDQYSVAEGMYQDAEWLSRMIENILGLTRLQEGRLVVNKRLEAIEEVVSEAVYRATKHADPRAIAVQVPTDLVMVPMDATLIEQVLINLIDNAIKHTGRNDAISVLAWVDQPNREVWFSVEDTGLGITPEDLPNLFTMFYTTSGKHEDARRGIGLGLTICKSIITAHGGRIEAANRANGPGAVFRFTLPMEEQAHE